MSLFIETWGTHHPTVAVALLPLLLLFRIAFDQERESHGIAGWHRRKCVEQHGQ
jgi:hypothetical protein